VLLLWLTVSGCCGFLQTKTRCDSCSVPGPNLWLCLHAKCFYVGCGDAADDHSTQHYDVCLQFSDGQKLTKKLATK